jgi:hypothetical protein
VNDWDVLPAIVRIGDIIWLLLRPPMTPLL